MGAYDDLLPQQEGQQPAGGAYGDLIPEEAPSEPSFGQQAKRAAGLSARQVGPRDAAAAAGATMGAPLAGVGAIPGALAGLTAFELVNLLDKVAGTNFLEKALTAAGLPTAETDTEKLVEGTTEAMSGMGGMTAGAKTVLRTAKGPVTRGLAEDLTQAPVMGQIAAGAAGAAGEATRQSGGDPVEQLLASGGAAAVAPVGTSLAQGVAKVGKNTIQDIIAAIRASGSNPNPEAVRRLESQAIDTLAKGQEGEVAAALRDATTHVRGAKPTVGEALTEYNMRHPYKQIGGGIIKIQDQLSVAAALRDATTHVRGAKPTVGEALTEYNMRHPYKQIGGAIIKIQDQLSGARW